MRQGFLCLVTVMAWRASTTMDVAVSVEALQEPLARFGHPGISARYGSIVMPTAIREAIHIGEPHRCAEANQVYISMDRRGRWMANMFIARLWRSLEYECVYLHAFRMGSDLRTRLQQRISYHNIWQPHSTLAGRMPDEAYGINVVKRLTA